MALSNNPRSLRKCRSPVNATAVRLISTTTSKGSHLGSLGKGSQNPGKTRYNLSREPFMINITFDRARAQNLLGTAPAFSDKI